MPTADRTEHDFLEMQTEKSKTQHDKDMLFLKEFLLGIVNERERKYEQRMDGFDKSFTDLRSEIKDALETATRNTEKALETATSNTDKALSTANANVRDALVTANANITAALASTDKRFESVNEFRGQLADQQESFARKSDVEQQLAALKEATLKYEAQVGERFNAVNAFRSQLAEQQATLVTKSEVNIRFEALEKKLDTAVAQLQMSEGRKSGFNAAGAIVAAAVTALLGATGIVLTLILSKAH